MDDNIVAVEHLGGHRLRLRFEDGAEGVLDFAEFIVFDGVFESLADAGEFARVYVDDDMGSIAWPNGADHAPEVLHSRVTGEPIVWDGEVVFQPPSPARP